MSLIKHNLINSILICIAGSLHGWVSLVIEFSKDEVSRKYLELDETSHSAQKINVVLGTNNFKNPDAGRLTFAITREGIFQHPKYNPSTVAYDIAIIRLPERVEFTGIIKLYLERPSS